MSAFWLVAAALVFLAACFRPIGNPDLFWHLSAGRDILATGSIPRTEGYSFTRFGSEWIDFEWLTQVLYSGIESRAGLWGLIGLKTILLSGTAFCLERLLARQSLPAPARAGALCFFTAGLLVVNDVRPENLSLLLFAAEWLILDGFQSSTKPGYPLLAASAAFFSLWANCHGGFISGLALLGCHAAGSLWEKPGQPRLRFYGSCLAAGILGSLLNPYGLRLYSVLWEHMIVSQELSELIVEWHPTGLANAGHWPFWILLGAAMITAAIGRLRRELSVAHLLALSGLALSGMGHNRQTVFFVLAGLACLPGAWWSAAAKGGRRTSRRAFNGGGGVVACLSLLFLMSFTVFVWPREPVRPVFPEKAVEFIQRHAAELAPLRMYNPWGWGGYIGRALGPSFRVFMDGRYLFHSLLAEENAATVGPEAWKSFVDKHRLDWLVLKRDLPDIMTTRILPGGRAEKEPRPYYLFFIPQDRWSLVYWDDLAMIFVSRSALPRAWLAEREYGVFHPGDIKALRRALAAEKLPKPVLRREICRHINESGADRESLELVSALGGAPCL